MASATARVPPTYVDPLPERRAQLDGLRVLALAGVLLVHFWLDDPIISHTRVSLFFWSPAFSSR